MRPPGLAHELDSEGYQQLGWGDTGSNVRRTCFVNVPTNMYTAEQGNIVG
jgi:hypothetical protein